MRPRDHGRELLRIPIFADPQCGGAMTTLHRESFAIPTGLSADLRRLVDEVRLDSRTPTQVFVAVHHGNFPNLEYLCAALRDRGVRTIGIYLRTPPPAGTFDAQLGLRGSLGALFEVARRLPPSPIYVQAHGRWSFLSQVLLAAGPEHRVVQELWDWMSAFIEPEHEASFVEHGVFERAEIRAMRISEAFVRERCAGFLYKEGGPDMEALAAAASVPSQRFYPCPPRSWMRPPRTAPPGDAWRLVHAGQLKNRTAPAVAFGDLHYLPVIRSLSDAGLLVTAYGAANGSPHDPTAGFSDYVEEAARNPRFEFRPRLPVRALIETLAATQDAGLLLYRFGPELRVGRKHLRSAVASKLFTYLAAGLPIIVSPELETMARFVRDHDIGLVVGFDEIAELPSRLACADLSRWAENIERVQHTFALENRLDRTLEFVRPPQERGAA